MRNVLYYAFIIVLCFILGFGMFFGIWLSFNPYLLTGNIRTEGAAIWNVGDEVEALILFNLSSRGFISANYPVEVSANVRVANNTLLSYLKGKNFVDLDVAGAYSYPIRYGPLGVYQGTISLRFDGNNAFQGTGIMLFPYKGERYFLQIFAYDSVGDISPPIYTMNVSDIGKSIPPVFLIEESYATRAQFENSNQKTGLSIVALVLSSIGIMISIQRKNVIGSQRTVSEAQVKNSGHKTPKKN
jgi:hypothetical protein